MIRLRVQNLIDKDYIIFLKKGDKIPKCLCLNRKFDNAMIHDIAPIISHDARTNHKYAVTIVEKIGNVEYTIEDIFAGYMVIAEEIPVISKMQQFEKLKQIEERVKQLNFLKNFILSSFDQQPVRYHITTEIFGSVEQRSLLPITILETNNLKDVFKEDVDLVVYSINQRISILLEEFKD